MKNDKVIKLYHGTTKEAGENILKDGKIKGYKKVDNDKFTFFTRDVRIATAYSIQATQLDNIPDSISDNLGRIKQYWIYVYEIEIREEELETKNAIINNEDNETYSALKGDISLDKYGSRLLKKYVTDEDKELDKRIVVFSDEVSKHEQPHFEENIDDFFGEQLNLKK